MIAFLSCAVWIYLVLAHGRFWQSGPELSPSVPAVLPEVDIIVPARDEAETIGSVIASLLNQDYPGRFRVVLVDDNSTDATAARAGTAANLEIIRGAPKPDGWSGKLWAIHQGVAASRAPLLLFTDADIVHDPRHLSSLIARLQQPRAEMVSEIVRLNCVSLAERALVPAFVYFFQLLYPFASVNDPGSRIAAASGGVVLIRRETLDRIGGIGSIRSALIDDVTLARAVKQLGPIYLGHTDLAASVRPYPHFADIWKLITRTAFTQLRYSLVLLLLTLAGLTIVWLVPVWAAFSGYGAARVAGCCAYGLSALSYVPTLRRYRQSPLVALAMPLIALFYMAATIGSAFNHWFGRGVSWKSRAYREER